MALNLVRNSRVFFTTNVDANGKILTTGFSTTNTQEIQVLDGFTFSQNTNQDTITISEAGSDPSRGQRSFNTSLAPVDFSFSTYVRPALVSSVVTAEESVLWNALLSTKAIDTSGTALGGNPSASYAWDAATGTGTLTITSMSVSSSISTGDAVTIAGLGYSADKAYEKALNTSAIVKSTTPTTTAGNTTAQTLTGIVLEYTNPAVQINISSGSFTTSATVTKLYTSPGWVSSVFPNADTNSTNKTYALSTVAGSNKNQLQKFAMLFIVDSITYVADNCAMNQVMIDFGLDAIATLQWTGQATALRDVTSSINLLATTPITLASGGTVTNIASTENIFVGNVVQYTGGSGVTSTGTGTNAAAATVTVATVAGANSLTLSGSTGSGTLTNVKVFNYHASATLGTVSGTGPWTTQLTVTNTQGISVGDVVTGADGSVADTGVWGTGTATVKSVDSATTFTVTFTGGNAPVRGSVSGAVRFVYVQIATLSQLGGTTQLSSGTTAAGKNTTAPFITNKLSTVTFKTVNALGQAAATTYKIALTGGSITINNNISYITPANLGVVNVPAVYYTGTRSITGTLNAYLRTGTGEGGTGQLLQDMLAASASTVEPMASLIIGIGGTTKDTSRIELEMPSVTFSIPTIDVQQVVSTAINFTAEGSVLGATAGNTFSVDEVNDLSVRYYAAA